jgi:formylglycine-generating enzyme
MKGSTHVYPDTLVWMSDFTYSYNEPLTRTYFWHAAYDLYPVVGVNWIQARAFSVWRTQLKNNFLSTQGETFVQDYRLPTEAEWEYAARGGLTLSPYPWGGPYTRNNLGCFIANFKPLRGNYGDDGGVRTVAVGSYEPNEYGLYDMAGNVAEWTSNAFDESAYSFTHDLNPDYRYNALKEDPAVLKRKVIRGGSWKDIGYYLQVGTRTYEYQDTTKSYIGFRNVRSYMGRETGEWSSQ